MERICPLCGLYSYLNLESTKTNKDEAINRVQLYSYLNLESTKTVFLILLLSSLLYSYLNLESTKTPPTKNLR